MSGADFAGASGLKGVARVPGDKSISHRALICAALAPGRSVLRGLNPGDDVFRTRLALAALGVAFDDDAVIGGRERLRPPRHALNLANSGTAMRLLAGVCATLPFPTQLDGDASLRGRPMNRVVEPLRRMGSSISAHDGEHAPLSIEPAALHGIDHHQRIPSAQVKGAILFAALGAEGTTSVTEDHPTRRHTEELFERCGAAITVDSRKDAYVVSVRQSELEAFELAVPGDPSQAAFLCVGAALLSQSDLRVEHVYCGPERLGFVSVLSRMGAEIRVEPVDEWRCDLVCRGGTLGATTISGEEIPDLIDELPALVVAACFAEGTTTIEGAAELRVKESDRIAAMTDALCALGAKVRERPDGFVIEGRGFDPRGAASSHGDHRVAMALAIAALRGRGLVHIEDFDVADVSWPGFADELGRLACR
ncbi:MAG: 3-phosphoshikimate 1-carboxyvinyltransferase [Acidimicrobiales bacterium]